MRTRLLTSGLLMLAAATAVFFVACGGGGNGGGSTAAAGGTPGAPETAGTKVEALAFSNCDRSWVRPEQVSAAYRMMLPDAVALYAVYEANDTSDTFDGGFGAQYVIVLTSGKNADGKPAGVALHVRDGRVTWIEHQCPDVAGLVASKRVKSFLVAPAATPSATAQSGDKPTGIPELDHLVQAARAGNVIELASLAGYQRVACVQGGSAAGPACR